MIRPIQICLLAMMVFSLMSGASANDRPNIVFLLVDDLAWSDLACYGHPYHRTANIDKLAAGGLRFTHGYSPAPICSASRASILTGKTPARLQFEFVTKNEPGFQKIEGDVPLQSPPITLNLAPSEATIAERLIPLGYKTAFFGKWHVCQHYNRKYLAWHPDYGPRQQGFAFAEEDFGDHPYAWQKERTPPDLPDGEFPVDTMIGRAADFIRRQAGVGQPYFLMASSFYVHTPVKNRCKWLVGQYEEKIPVDSPNRSQRMEYAAFVETLDHHVGTILDAIDESGEGDNTLVFFMSDNGGHPEYCSNAPLRGSKWNLYEGGIRVPMIARWPGTIRAGSTADRPVIGYDLLPTFVEVAGGDGAGSDEPVGGDGRVGKGAKIDGLSVCGAWQKTDWNPDRSLIWHFPYYHPERGFADAPTKIGVDDFVTSQTRPQSAIRRGAYKLIHFAEDDRVELYDLSNDVSEQNDLAATHPKIAERLRGELDHRLNAIQARRAVPR